MNGITINATDEEAISASADGSCIVWNLIRGVRTNALFASTLFRAVVYHPDESQLLTCGSDRKVLVPHPWLLLCVFVAFVVECRVGFCQATHTTRARPCLPPPPQMTYWDTSDCNAIRILDGATAELNSLDIEPDGVAFASAGNDKLVKVWHYDEGTTIAVGAGHSGGISQVRISPDVSKIVSVGSEGAIFIWSMPAVRA